MILANICMTLREGIKGRHKYLNQQLNKSLPRDSKNGKERNQ